jgi:hypothetical protein
MYVSRQELGDAYDENAMKRQLAIIAPVLIAVSLVTAGSAKAGTPQADIALLAGIPDPPNSKPLGARAIPNGGQQASFTTSADPDDVVASYQQTLPGAGWTVTGSRGAESSHEGGAGLQATNGPRYLSIDAGGPAGTTYVNICVWPSRPNDDHCGG